MARLGKRPVGETPATNAQLEPSLAPRAEAPIGVKGQSKGRSSQPIDTLLAYRILIWRGLVPVPMSGVTGQSVMAKRIADVVGVCTYACS